MRQDRDSVVTPSEIAALTQAVAELRSEVERTKDRQQIVDVFRRYTRGLNRYDVELIRSAFWRDAQINYGFDSRSRDAWVSYWQEERHLKGRACQAHHITNETVEIAGDVAHVETYLIAFRVEGDKELSSVVGGRYIDRFDRRNGEWRIAVREFIPHFTIEGVSRFHRLPWPKEGQGVGACDKSDPVYLRPLNPRPD